MGKSKMVATYKRHVYMAHVCSGCGFPVITAVLIVAEAQKYYSFLQSKAALIANEAAEDAIYKIVKNIETCYNTQRTLTGRYQENALVSPECYCTSTFHGYASSCPRCLNAEPWQEMASAKRMADLDRENFPIVFADSREAEKWALEKVRKTIADINESRKDHMAVKNAIQTVIAAKIEIKTWMNKLNSISETMERDRLQSVLKDTEKLKSQVGIFDRKGKRIVNERIKALESQIRDLNETIEKKTRLITSNLGALNNQLLRSQLIAFGCEDNIVSKKRANAVSYFVCANDIPSEIIDVIASFDFKGPETAHDMVQEITQMEKPSIAVEKPTFCRKCGFKLLPDSVFCTQCGTKVE